MRGSCIVASLFVFISGFFLQTKAEDHRQEFAQNALPGVATSIPAELEPVPGDWQQNAARIALARKRALDFRANKPEVAAAAEAAIGPLNQAIMDGLPQYIASLEKHGTGWEAVYALGSAKVSVEIESKRVPALASYVKALDARRNTLLQPMRDQAAAEIAAYGHTMADLEALIDLAEAKTQPFETIRAAEQVAFLEAATAERVEYLVQTGFPAFKDDITALEHDPETATALRSLLAEYSELELAAPAFAPYRELIEDRLAGIEQADCAKVYEKTGLSDSIAAKSILGPDGPMTIGQFVCTSDTAGNSLNRFETSFFSSTIEARYVGRDGSEASLELRPSPDNADDDALIGIAIEQDGERKELSREEWLIFSTATLRPPPSGVPDESGVTECDRLAADPDDPQKLDSGISGESLNVPLALEACIAALEYAPDNARLKFQLGRVLQAAGLDEAKAYLENAAAENYAAAHVVLGDTLLLDGDEATEKAALAHYRNALAGGYEAVADKAAALAIANMPDLSKGWPKSGIVAFECFTAEEAADQHGETGYFESGQFKLAIDLDQSSGQFDYSGVFAWYHNPLMEIEKPYAVTDNGDEIAIRVESFGDTLRPSFILNKQTLKIRHWQRLFIGRLINLEINGSLNIEGECMQSVE